MEYDNDFLGSYADENVTFKTEIVKTASIGDNFWKVLIFTDPSCTNYASSGNVGWARVPGQNALCASMTADDYTTYINSNTSLLNWCSDLFDPGFTGDLYVVIPALVTEQADGDGNTEYSYTPMRWSEIDSNLTDDEGQELSYGTTMTKVYNYLKPYAYHKTIFTETYSNDYAEQVLLAQLCSQDKQLLSGCPLFPYSNYTDTTTGIHTDGLFNAIKDSGYDAFFSACMSDMRNGSLVSLGIALAETNGSGTCVGNGMDMTSTSSFICSGENGQGLDKAVRDFLAQDNIQTWKWVGNNTGDVAAYGEKTLLGDIYVANWIIAYISYMVKVGIAELLTSRNFLKNEGNYGKILSTMNVYLGKFGPSGSGRLDDLQTTAPAFSELPATDSETLIIPKAWTAKYVGRLAKVEITGTLYLGD